MHLFEMVEDTRLEELSLPHPAELPLRRLPAGPQAPTLGLHRPFPSISALAGATIQARLSCGPQDGGDHSDIRLLAGREPPARRCLSPVTRPGKEFGDSNTWSMW